MKTSYVAHLEFMNVFLTKRVDSLEKTVDGLLKRVTIIEEREEKKDDHNTLPKVLNAQFKWENINTSKFTLMYVYIPFLSLKKASKQKTRENGKRVVSKDVEQKGIFTTNTGYNSGKITWRIKANKAWDNNGCPWIGVVTIPKCQGSDSRYLTSTDDVGLSYAVDCRKSCGSFSSKGSGKYELKNHKSGGWVTGQSYTILLDCETWQLTFWLEEERKGTVVMEPNKTYYPAMSLWSGKGNDVSLIVGE